MQTTFEKEQADQIDQSQIKQSLNDDSQFAETKYRWIIVAITCSALFFNGLANNIIMPIASRISQVYGESDKLVNSAAILSFLVFCLVNIPANHVLDKKGVRFGFLIGGTFYALGLFLCSLINKAFALVIVGYAFISLGQPFILNSPAKIATYWFLPKNRTLFTSIFVACNIFGSGIGYAIPPLVLNNTQDQAETKKLIFQIYLGYMFTSVTLLLSYFFLMRSKPVIPASKIQQKQQIDLKSTLSIIKKDNNLWKFFLAYMIINGSFQTFTTAANFILKPYGYTDIQITICAILLIIFGVIGAILASLYIKKTGAYKRVITITTIGVCLSLLGAFISLAFIKIVAIISIMFVLIGFFLTPIVPITYQIGCQIAFPIGQAQITGVLNGLSQIWAFIIDLILTAAIGFGSTTKSSIFMLFLIGFIIIGSVIYYFVKFDFKRKQYEQKQMKNEQGGKKEIEMTSPQKQLKETDNADSIKSTNYQSLVQEGN